MNKNFNKTLLLIIILNFLSKIVLINWNGAEYTDSISYMTISTIGKSKWMPVYPYMIYFVRLFVRNPLYSGRLTSIIISTLSLLPLYSITRRLYDKRAALYSSLLYIVAPMITRWSIRVMTEASFSFFLLLSLWFIQKWYDSKKEIYLSLMVGFTGIAALTRPEGIALLPLALFFVGYIVFNRTRLRFSCLNIIKTLLYCITGLVPWALQILWHWKIVGRYGYGQELHGGIEKVTVAKYFKYFGLYFAYLPYIITPFVFAFSIYGIYKSIRLWRENSFRIIYLLISAYILLSWIIGLSFHWAFTTRFMFPIVVLMIIFSGYGISNITGDKLRKAFFSICMVTSLAFTVIVLIYSRATFEDIRYSAYFIRDNVPVNAKIFSTELGKTRFWSGRKIDKYNREKLNSGDYVMLQNIYTDFDWELKYLKDHYKTDIIYYKSGVVIPLLADEMYMRSFKRRDGTIGYRGSGNQPISLNTQFSKHKFESVVILIKGRSN
ncbi:hypothetical protein GF312_03320 [Candidatus Poribacteria bacterium]|nr:hypothetical protein [Candidatus Poribacteria bacterium]